VVTPSLGMQRWLAYHWGVRAGVIRYPFVLPDLSQRDPDTRGVLFVGRLEYRKGIDTLLRAWSRVEADAALTIVGRDVIDYRTNTSIGARLLGGLERTEFLGPQPPEHVAQLQADASVVVVPSPDDNFPFTCIEALAAGCVVVAAGAGGASEMIEHGTSGLLFQPYDHGDLAHALTAALRMSDTECDAMGHAARERIAVLCDARHILDQRLAHAAASTGSSVVESDHRSGVPIELRTMSAPFPSRDLPAWKRFTRRLLGR
ncbi:MAG: glycosyltransferase, partial [Planctomycetota bacterium]